jgi:excisionase family DNA binding protein
MADTRTQQASFEWTADRPASPAGEACRAPSAVRPPEPAAPAAQRASRPRLNTGERLVRWLTADEATAYLGFPSRKALFAAVERGQVPGHKLGRRLRFSRSELDALLGRR